MAKHVLVPYDGAPQSRDALRHVLDEYADARITVLHAIDLSNLNVHYQRDVVGFDEDWYERAEDYADELLAGARELADEAGVDVNTEAEFGRPHEVVLEYVDDNDVDLVVVGSHGRSGISRVLLGSVAETVARRAPVPVLIIK